ncbi:Ig-like domain repeat protein [Nocardia sp. NBC_00511]|uniref:Ig-like domain repeat protein n=1 Tax=Nocardia sp. NBC_00511 TaxID=2903591 RepID=UPI0030E4FD49
MRAFDPNDYRKRVLAAVERRGGLEESDAFELYDIPLEEAAQLTDEQVRARIDEVWAFWQKQRDHPKYRVIAGLLVDVHKELSEPLLDNSSRLIEADRVRQARARRDAGRYEMLDSAIQRLVQRHGGIPAAKIPGLEDIGRMGDLSLPEIAARIRRHRIIDDTAPVPAAPPGVSSQRRNEIRKLLSEYDRLLPGDPVPTLLALLGLDFTKAHQTAEIRLRAEALRARTRELPPGRVRVVLDELLVHISDLLEPGRPTVDAYLDAVIDDATERLRPQVRAAVLVEDLLVAADFDYLIGEGIAAGLDRATTEGILIGLADELGTTVEGREHLAGGGGKPSDAEGSGRVNTRRDRPRGQRDSAQGRGEETSYRTGTAAAASGSPVDSGARGTSTGSAGTATNAGRGTNSGEQTGAGSGTGSWTAGDQARETWRRESGGAAGDSTRNGPPPARWQTTPYGRPWEAALRAARAALRAGRPREAGGFVEDARRSAGADAVGATAVRAVAEEVERVLAEAAAHWRGAVSACAGRRFVEALAEHLEFLERRAADVPNPDLRGASRELLTGRARAAVIEAGRLFAAAPVDPADVRMRALRGVLEACADHAEALAALAELRVGTPGQVTARRKSDGTVVITWTPSSTEQVEYRVTRLLTDGSWRVVGRTRGTALEDGGALTGPMPVYGVVASVSGLASEMSRSDGNPERPPVTATPETAVANSAADARPSGMPPVHGMGEQAGLLTFDWPVGITEVMVVARADAPPVDPEDPQARRWKITNMRYEIDGGVRIPGELPRPCHLAVASCRRDAAGVLTVAAGFGPDARLRWVR